MNIFKHNGNGRWGIEDGNAVVYEAGFKKKVAVRIIQLESSNNPPVDWEETRKILEREGFTEKDFDKITQ